MVAPLITLPSRYHTYWNPVPVVAFKIALPPLQNVVPLGAVMLALGPLDALTLTPLDVAEHEPLLTVTVYVPEVVAV